MKRWLALVLLVMAGAFLCPGDAHATFNCTNRPYIPMNPLLPVTATSNVMNPTPSGGAPGSTYQEASGPRYQILHRLVGCLEDTIYRIGLSSFTNFRVAMQGAVVATITLFVAIFFTKAMMKAFQQGEAAEFSIMALKLTGVGVFVLATGVEDFMPAFYRGLQWFTEVVTGATPGPASCNYARLWLRIDCGISNIIAPGAYGVVGTDTPWVLLGIATQGLFTAGGGIVLLLLVPFLLLLMIAAFATATLAYIMCLIALMILLMISPIMIPLYLFSFTNGIFQIWFRLIIGYMLQPMLLFAYLAFMMHVVGYIVFGPTGLPSGGPSNSVLGLAPIIQDIAWSMTNNPSDRPVITGQTRVESGSGPPSNTPATQRNDEVEGWSFVVSDFQFPTGGAAGNTCLPFSGSPTLYASCRHQHLNVNLVALIVTMALTFSFMNTVMTRAGELVGIGASASFMQNINIYGQMVQFMQAMAKDVTVAVASGGSDLSFKSTVNQSRKAISSASGIGE